MPGLDAGESPSTDAGDAGGGELPDAAAGDAGPSEPPDAGRGDGCPAEAPLAVNRVRLYVAPGAAAGLVGGRIQGSHTGPTTDFVDLATIGELPAEGAFTELRFANAERYRFVKYTGPSDRAIRLAEIELYHDQTRLRGAGFGTAAATAPDRGYERALDADVATVFESSEPGAYVGLDLGGAFVAQAPTFTPPGGSFEAAPRVALASATPGATIRYTLDGSSPARARGTLYDGPIVLTSGRVTIKAVASADCYFESPVAEASYAIGPSTPPPSGSVRSYHIGNSLTDTLNDWLAPIADSAGADHTYARWTIPGATIGWLASHKGDGFGTPEGAQDFDRFVQQFAPIDHMSVQPFSDPSLTTQAGPAVSLFAAAQASSPALTPWIYAQWPSLTEWRMDALAVGASWADPPWTVPTAPTRWEEAVDNQLRFHEAFRQYVDDRLAGKGARIVPAGSALVALKRAIESGQVPGMSDFRAAAFTDDLHLTPSASYLVALVFYSCFYGQSPEGRATFAGTGLTAEQAAILQRIAWDTVRGYAWSGVAP